MYIAVREKCDSTHNDDKSGNNDGKQRSDNGVDLTVLEMLWRRALLDNRGLQIKLLPGSDRSANDPPTDKYK